MIPDFPSFSMILETVNLELAELDGLRDALTSISEQDFDVRKAREILMVESGDVPQEKLAEITRDFPWLTVMKVPPGTGYEEAKMLGTARCSGEIVVFFDADCRYEKTWLRGLLEGFQQHPELGVLGGETMIRADSVIGLATSVLFTFNFYSDRQAIYKHERIHLNNAAFRREVLRSHPFPTRLALFRMSSRLYVKQLKKGGIGVARQPRSRAMHAPPNGLGHYFWRFLMFGHDAVNVYRLADAEDPEVAAQRPARGRFLGRLLSLISDRGLMIFSRLTWLIKANPRHLLRLPLALPLIAIGGGLMLFGYLSALLFPRLLPSLMPNGIQRGADYAQR